LAPKSAARRREQPLHVILCSPWAINKHIASITALGRVGLPDDIGPSIAALLSDANRWVNAQRIEISGGMML
jgi:NAD(P)-dependent dehydrogenase (short-subunit alcohol dehydrogenase family)